MDVMAFFLIVVVLLLPWIGGLWLIWSIFRYMRMVVWDQAKWLEQLRGENEEMRHKRNEQEEQIHLLNLRLQTTMVENALLSARHEQEGSSS